MTHLDRLAGRAHARNAPLSALFELTGRCNLACAHCHLDVAHPPSELTTAQALHVVDELRRAGTLFLALSGGEVLLREDALEVVRHARRLGMAVRIFTNATLVTPALADEIAAVKPLAVEVSLYGASVRTHDAVTRRRAFRRTLRGVLLLRRAGITVGLKAPLLSSVAGELERILAIADRIGARVGFDPVVTPRLDGSPGPTELRATPAELARLLEHVRLGTPPPLPSPPPLDEIPCALGTRTVRISAAGDVYPCASYPVPVGNVLERPFSEIWAGGELLDRLRALRVRDLTGECAGCPRLGYCHRCSAVALLEHGDALGPSRESCRIARARECPAGAGRCPGESKEVPDAV
jgi:radical SAM protein with 4Fe4S-binding SPASM domain